MQVHHGPPIKTSNKLSIRSFENVQDGRLLRSIRPLVSVCLVQMRRRKRTVCREIEVYNLLKSIRHGIPFPRHFA